jgi:hypothetical protein
MLFVSIEKYHELKKMKDIESELDMYDNTQHAMLASSIRTLVRIIIHRIENMDEIPQVAKTHINSMKIGDLQRLAIDLYNLQTYLCT